MRQPILMESKEWNQSPISTLDINQYLSSVSASTVEKTNYLQEKNRICQNIKREFIPERNYNDKTRYERKDKNEIEI